MQTPQQPREKPPDDEMHSYDTKDLQRLFGLPASAIRSLTRAGHISPVKRGRHLHYSFQDLLMMRTASALRAANISAHRINRTLRTFRAALPPGPASHKQSLTALGDQIAVREGKLTWESDSGQYVLALGLGGDTGGVYVISRPTLPAPTPAATPASAADCADELYARAVEIEDSDAIRAQAAYAACLEVDPHHIESRINLGRLLHNAGRFLEAERLYRGAHKTEPLLAFNLGVLLEDLDRDNDAIAAYREALALDPGLADAHFNLARLYEKASDLKTSLRHLLAYRRMMNEEGN